MKISVPVGSFMSALQILSRLGQLPILAGNSVQHLHHLLLLQLATHRSLVLELDAQALSQPLQCSPLALRTKSEQQIITLT